MAVPDIDHSVISAYLDIPSIGQRNIPIHPGFDFWVNHVGPLREIAAVIMRAAGPEFYFHDVAAGAEPWLVHGRIDPDDPSLNLSGPQPADNWPGRIQFSIRAIEHGETGQRKRNVQWLPAVLHPDFEE